MVEGCRAVIITHNNEIGLNSLLWSLVMSDDLPEGAIILNHGRRLKEPTVHKAISALASRIPVELVRMPNPGYLNQKQIRLNACSTTDAEIIWMLDDDNIVFPLCYRELKKFGKACLPLNVDEDVWFDQKEECEKIYKAEKPVRVRRGGIVGIRIKRLDLKNCLESMPSEMTFLEDDYVLRHLEVSVVPTAKLIHQGITEPNRPMLYKRIEELERIIDRMEGREWKE